VLPDYHTHTMAGLRMDTAAFGPLMAAALPDLHAHFELIEVRRNFLFPPLFHHSRSHPARYRS
jgi:hypothetical protein